MWRPRFSRCPRSCAVYLLGRWLGPAAARRVFAGERGARRRVWAERSLHRFGARMIIGCRFIPGGRTAVTLTCGLVGYPRRRFVVATAVASVIWASYAFLIGRLGGHLFADRPWLGLLLALGITVAVSVAIEAARRARAWRLGGGGLRARPHDLHTGCAVPAPGPGVLKGAPGRWPRGTTTTDAVQAAEATAHRGASAVAE